MKKSFILAGLLVLAGSVFAGPDSARPVSNVRAKVLKDFAFRFNAVRNSRWVPDSKGSVMYFNRDGFLDRAIYDKQGRWQYSLIFYHEGKMPWDIRKVVKREYYDLAITV